MIGGLIMTHSDDDGLVLPPRVASAHVVLLPIHRKPEEREQVMGYTERLAADLRRIWYHERRIVVEIDNRDIGGARGWDWIKKGVPLRVEIGPRDIAEDSVFVARRDLGPREKRSIGRDRFLAELPAILDEIQLGLFKRAGAYRREHTRRIDERESFDRFFTAADLDRPEIHGGFALSHWCERDMCEGEIKETLQVTIRCIPLAAEDESGVCICCGRPSKRRVVWAKAY
jgi:prolyl-tRNA synthetase